MPKAASILRKLAFHNAWIFCSAIFVIMLVLFLFLYHSSINTRYSEMRSFTDGYAERVKNEIALSTTKTEYIINNSTILENLNIDFTGDFAAAYNFSRYLNEYLDVITIDSAADSILIYTGNPSLPENKYLRRSQSLPQFDYYVSHLKDNSVKIAWEEEIHYADDGDVYITFYRYVPNVQCLIKVNVLFPPYTSSLYQTSVGVNPNESQNTGVFSTIANGFFIAAELDPDVIQQTRLFFTLLFIGIYAAFVLAILWLSWMNSRKTVLSIKYLLSVLEMHDFQRDIVLSIPQDTYELAVIKEAVLKLMDGISAANDAANQALQENMRLSLELLQYKLNPHLLYNSLTLISLIATQKKDTETIRVVDALVDYYRSVMKKTDVSTIGEELDSLRLFVNINAISQRKDIQLIIESDDRLSSIAIPHLLLQPIVENAVGHGLASMLKDCLIRIHVYREGKYVHVDIFDNGIGIEEDILAELNRRQGARLGYGVNNTYERLRLFSDGNCGMQFESVPYQVTVAHLWFKIPEAKDSLSSL